MHVLKQFYSTFKDSLTSSVFYNSLSRQKLTSSLVYLFFLLYIISQIISSLFAFKLWQNRSQITIIQSKISLFIQNAFPSDGLQIEIKNGRLNINKPQPYFYSPDKDLGWTKNPRVKKHFVTIDISGSADSYYKYDSEFLFTGDKAIYAGNNGIEELPFEGISDTTINKDSYLRLVSDWQPILNSLPLLFNILLILLITILPFFLTIPVFIFRLLYLLLFTYYFRFLISLFHIHYSFRHLYQILIHTSTLPTIFFTLLSLFSLTPEFPFGYSLLLTFFSCYIIYQIKPLKNNP